MSDASWQPAGTVRTDDLGRFRYQAAPGPARVFRFRYAGSPLIRGATATVRLKVPAATSLDVSRRHVVNGEYVTFSGRLKGGSRPPEGTLVELQVFTRRRWRTFAQPRAPQAGGRWTFQYRFETIRGSVTFRFRARIRRQSRYPFGTGVSRTVRVHVQGL